MSRNLLGKKRTERNFENEEYEKFSNIKEDKNNINLPFKKIITEKITDYEILDLSSNNDNNKNNNKIEIKNEIKKEEKINNNLDTPIFGFNKNNKNLLYNNESKKKII